MPSPIRFKPVPATADRSGWTPEKQEQFIEVLAATKSVTRASAAVGMTRGSAYYLRKRPEAATGFAIAWLKALATTT